ncbi:MAG: hypothetical protein IJ092_11390 [Atopobiaceae bacterium]|nr:hypothetical protein [Atopobiaceae bacterium]MBR1828175.1 hypothetical protein [Atopobiaceae bacterium]
MATIVVLSMLFFVLPIMCWVFGLVMRMLGWTLRAVFSVLGIFLFPIILLAALAQGAFMLAVPLGVCWLVYSMVTAE